MSITSTAVAGINLPHPVIILGRDDSGKAHASFFSATDAQPASRAASLMGMFSLKADNDAVRSLLPKLPKGKLFDSGKAFVPFVKQDLYKQIAAHLPEADRVKAEIVRAAPADVSQQGHAATPSNVPDDWSKILVGSLVLATDDPLEGWFEATVIELKPDNVLRLQWRHYLDLPPFNRKIEDVALLHPSMKL
ncbi:hypothetical protein ELI20_01200 [Rhizobium ruizarguesonis]|jgi:hypothetical protein|uniref:hypothetical protein n=1 Tax=Rhizobium TaxID=379 RepID=UPI00102FB691|nr:MULTISPECIES: hypothetical protein [Rhizobium]QIO58713.1 hypothetical protein HA463_13885 [Rhizobium leguminosarum bv. trifolii]TAW19933.1 hypothetical protein ELI20_01200 [Rhizobium ruizarguesonis]TBC33808.1 hypothetical protein ELH33_01170 [Rhizobium ruizarguesonis]